MAGRKQIAVSTRCRARGRPRTKDNFLSRAFCIGIDQRWLVENCTIPLAAVNGSEDQPRYLEVPKYANPWEGSLSSARLEACAVLGSTGVFDELLGKFVDDVAPR